jgi:mannose-6-phosphate isomerase
MLILFPQNDDWGKKGNNSIVAQLWSKTPGSPGIDESKHYSEVGLAGYDLKIE